MSDPTKLEDVANAIAEKHDVDVLLYNSHIARTIDATFIRSCEERRRRKNVLVLLVTEGGDADAAFRIARCLQSRYEKFTVFVSGYCKSAGTLIAVGAHELVFGPLGELGPLDAQISKKDELFEFQSGLTVMDAITALNEKAFTAFEAFFLQTKVDVGAITMHSAAEIATELTTGLFSELYAQLDPMHLGEAARALRIADHYGRRLLEAGGNIDVDALKLLNTNYPHHGFVIDRTEAEKLFQNVREASMDELRLVDLLGLRAVYPDRGSSGTHFEFLNTEPPPPAAAQPGVSHDGQKQGATEGQQPQGPPAQPGEQPKAPAAGDAGNVAQLHPSGAA